MASRWYIAVALGIVLTVVIAFASGALRIETNLSTCGGMRLADGRCGPIPLPGEPGATCVPQPGGACTWFWESGYPKDD